MKKTQFIKNRLNRHRKMLEKFEALKEELSFIMARYGSPRSPNLSGVPSGGSSELTETEQIVHKKMELEEKIKNAAAEISDDWSELSPLFNDLGPMQTLIINLRYQYGASWKEICKQIYGRREDYDGNMELYMKRIYNEHGRALLFLSERHST